MTLAFLNTSVDDVIIVQFPFKKGNWTIITSSPNFPTQKSLDFHTIRSVGIGNREFAIYALYATAT